MLRRTLVLLAVLRIIASPLGAAETTRLIAAQPSKLVLEGSSNVAPWRCSGTTLDGRMSVAAPLAAMSAVVEGIEDFELTVPVATLRCGNRQMERDMYRALRSDSYPTIEFRFADLIGGVTGIDGGRLHARIAGELALAGAKRSVAVDVIAERVAPGRFRLHARLPLRMSDFRITPPTALFGMVRARNDLVVQFDLVLEDHS